MTEISKPDYSTGLWSSGGSMVTPSNVKIQTGWTAEVPPFQWENWAQNRQDQAIAHILQHGISVWDANTEYQWSSTGTKSRAMGSNGVIYQAVQVSTGHDPVTDSTNTYWIRDDSTYAKLSNNGSDYPSPITFRTNLSLYSKSEIDSKTAMATTLQAQQHTSSSVLINPLNLLQSFQGANQSLATSGFQVIGNFILQWATGSSDASGNLTVTLPTPFPTAILGGIANEAQPSGWASNRATVWGFDLGASTTTIAVARCRDIVGAAGPAVQSGVSGRILVWGY